MATTFDPNPVYICDKCGRGFIGRAPRIGQTDTLPIWWLVDGAEGPTCGGKIIMKRRKAGDND